MRTDHVIDTTMMTRGWSRRAAVLLFASVLGAAMPAGAQEPPALREAPVVEETRQLLLAAYPELTEGRIAWRVTTTPTGVVVEAHRVETPFATLLPDALALVSGTVLVDDHGRLQSLSAGGSVLDALRRKATAVAARQPRDVDEALKGEGAKYAPSVGEKASALAPAGVKQLLRTSVVRAQMFQTDPPPDRVNEGLTWQVELEGAEPAPPSFIAVFEPIEGRLMSVVRR
jgi:hypothetical protein